MAKDIIWNIGAEREFKGSFPDDLQDAFLLALKEVASKRTPAIRDTPHGEPFGNEVWKLKAKDSAGQWRVVYVRPYEEAIYVINAYQKKSPSGGSEEAPEDIRTTRKRLMWAEAEHEIYLAEKAAQDKAKGAKTNQGGKNRKGGKK